MAIDHGGKLNQFARKYHSDPKDWLDLSTGVSPFPYPVESIPLSVWNRLPEVDDGLAVAAKEYYGAPCSPLAVAGTQAAIMVLPKLVTLSLGRCGTVALPRIGYKEHQHAWQEMRLGENQWRVELYDDLQSQQQIEHCDVVVIIHPNNPNGRCYQPSELMHLGDIMTKKGGFLVVDEAFVDCTPNVSLFNHMQERMLSGVIVLRSVGKFFGLAGARVGFVFAQQTTLDQMQDLLGPWTVAGPARWAVKQALLNRDWQTQARKNIHFASQALNRLLDQYLPSERVGTDLFTTVYLHDARQCHEWLCQSRVLTRLCDENNALRFGLPANPQQFATLEAALLKLSERRNRALDLPQGDNG
ncbi:threonine-phosphate decarboxylase CobD [Vibrio panuliri]|uniref:threonine-phosphate decarboxylase n=1 Tax=Vibrio panuliri TaxID=1381081 RepID=A0ABX3F3R6_9VIBR|nr:threonine-phosphate decarboxylase CobD [Vibrio panuliri]KAB1454023.1 threonine-phosphate decarboxylase [Vibrio panuliri]OLQ84436.1 threonine-phosphate decarboxylase [Vibrio panuliri]